MKVPKALIHYEDMPDGTICRVSKYKYVQTGKRVWFPTPIMSGHYFTVHHFGIQLGQSSYHFHDDKLFIHFYLPYRDHVYLRIYQYQNVDMEEETIEQ